MDTELTLTPEVPARPAAEPLISRLLLLFMLAMILANMGGNMYGQLMPLYLQDLGASVKQVGLFFTISQVIPLVLQILGGWISDTLGRLRAIAIGSVAGIFVYVAMLWAPSWQWLLVAMAFSAITRSLIGPSFDAFIAEHSSEKNRARVFAISQALFQIVAVAGPPLGGWLAQSYGFKPMLMVAAVLYILATVIRVGMAREAARSKESKPQKLSLAGLKSNLGTMFRLLFAGGVITWIFVTDGARDVAFSLSFNFLPIYMKDIAHLNLGQIGAVNGIVGLFTMLSILPGGWLADKKGERAGIASGFVLMFVALVMFVSLKSFASYCASCALAGTGMGVMIPGYQSLITKVVPKKVLGTAFGLFSTSLGLISLPAPYIGGELWKAVSPQFPFLITAGVILLMVVPVWLFFKAPKGEAIDLT